MNDTASIIAEIVKYFRPPQVEAIVPLAEAARLLHMKPCTLRNLVYRNKIGFIVDGKNYYFKVSDLNDYINAHYTPQKYIDITTKNERKDDHV